VARFPAAALHHYSAQAVAVMVVILVIGYLLILRRRRPGDRRDPAPKTDPNRFELPSGPPGARARRPGEGPGGPTPPGPPDDDEPGH